MTRREVLTKAIARQLTWGEAAVVLGITERHLRRIRRVVERHGMEAVLERRGGRTVRRRRIKAATIELLCRLKRDVYGDFSVRHSYEQVTEKHRVKVSPNKVRGANGQAPGRPTDAVPALATHSRPPTRICLLVRQTFLLPGSNSLCSNASLCSPPSGQFRLFMTRTFWNVSDRHTNARSRE